ncbi:hypothetical protein ElyMa_003546400 [Elysia marginata]|uniref:Uncharacterized protein n=1 Tax=Elysia marginata TaxID=1093978 RepID=A0AAV4EIQ8_9GAST|nr:hypothetical protein ElyMa_003546400 [Elysia marginata]
MTDTNICFSCQQPGHREKRRVISPKVPWRRQQALKEKVSKLMKKKRTMKKKMSTVPFLFNLEFLLSLQEDNSFRTVFLECVGRRKQALSTASNHISYQSKTNRLVAKKLVVNKTRAEYSPSQVIQRRVGNIVR